MKDLRWALTVKVRRPAVRIVGERSVTECPHALSDLRSRRARHGGSVEPNRERRPAGHVRLAVTVGGFELSLKNRGVDAGSVLKKAKSWSAFFSAPCGSG